MSAPPPDPSHLAEQAFELGTYMGMLMAAERLARARAEGEPPAEAIDAFLTEVDAERVREADRRRDVEIAMLEAAYHADPADELGAHGRPGPSPGPDVRIVRDAEGARIAVTAATLTPAQARMLAACLTRLAGIVDTPRPGPEPYVSRQRSGEE